MAATLGSSRMPLVAGRAGAQCGAPLPFPRHRAPAALQTALPAQRSQHSQRSHGEQLDAGSRPLQCQRRRGVRAAAADGAAGSGASGGGGSSTPASGDKSTGFIAGLYK